MQNTLAMSPAFEVMFIFNYQEFGKFIAHGIFLLNKKTKTENEAMDK
ncbi:hypothetical protein K3495_g9589 [Podosphaera aphanis]|nr:hypothetical protein K3495_g9589 [Podosphaera aphanis]